MTQRHTHITIRIKEKENSFVATEPRVDLEYEDEDVYAAIRGYTRLVEGKTAEGADASEA